ncbi:MAG: flavin reductase family protein [Planctomycetota bacterium]|jgi:flavin reductase (DIM6/NTAB) family NADH-FMN oxidoreductase RutF
MLKQVSYSEAIVSKYPEQIVIGIARDSGGKDNPITLGWTTIVSHVPPMMAVSIGKTRYSLAAFRGAGEFVIVFPSEYQKDEAMLFGTRSGRDVDKFAAAGTVLVPACKIDSVLMADAVANFECKLVSELETGDHFVFVGEVICAHLNEKSLNRLYTVDVDYKMGGLPRG